MMIFHQVENTKRGAGVIIQYQLYIMQLQRTEIQTKNFFREAKQQDWVGRRN